MEVKNSDFLAHLMQMGKAMSGTANGSLTCERLLAAAIDYLFLRSEQSWEEKFREEASVCHGMMHNQSDIRWPEVYSLLMPYIGKTSAGDLVIDSILTQKLLMMLRQNAEKEKREVLSADAVLAYLLINPTPTIKEVLSGEGAQIPVKMPDLVQEPEAPAQPEKGADTIAKLTDRAKKLQDALLSEVFGQDHAIGVVTSGYFQSELLALTDAKRVRPRATFLFAGPPGVGKTFLAETIAKHLALPFMRFDMSEYSENESNIEFCGSDKVYKNGKSGNVTSFVEKNPHCVLLFDEIEKAHLNVIHLFLQMLDAGRLRDNYTDTEVPFKDAIVIMTTNAGKQLYTDSESGDFSGVSRKVILKALSTDTNPQNGAPFFPAAICSRFASGNVVMFNQIGAHNLRGIAQREILRHAANFREKIGIPVEVDQRVFTALLLAEGGKADARTIRARSESFFDDEIYELFRLLSAEGTENQLKKVESIRMDVELPDEPEIAALFQQEQAPRVLLFADEQVAAQCAMHAFGHDILHVQEQDRAVKLLKEQDIQLILIDPTYGQYTADKTYLNTEDVDSKARDFFRMLQQNFSSIPVYLLQNRNTRLSAEEKMSFTRAGVRGVLDLGGALGDHIGRICRELHQQESMNRLAKANKILSFETAQTVTPDGKCAEIRLFDFALSMAVDAEDGNSILSSASKPNVRFADVIGAEDAQKELQYFVEYLKDPKKYAGTGVRAPRGVLLYGPPGTGKTMLAKAMACESDVTFIAAEGNQFLRKYVGEGKDQVHELFRTARKYAPSILFIDEIDAIARERRGAEGVQSDEATLTAFLTEMDGFKNDPSRPVFVLAATNFDVTPGSSRSLDPALLRRFDRRVYIDLPNKADRIRYIRMKADGNRAFAITQELVENISMRSTGMSLAELESVMELALRSAIRAGSDRVTDAIFEDAFETFHSGDVKKWDASQLERVARHETGHAFLSWHSGDKPSYLTVVARGNHGGYMQHGDHEGKAIYTKEELLARIRTALGGRAAELLYYGEAEGNSTGASGDLVTATKLAQSILCTYGMDAEFGLAAVSAEACYQGELAERVHTAVNQILQQQLSLACKLLEENREKLDRMVQILMEKDHLNGSQIDEIFRK